MAARKPAARKRTANTRRAKPRPLARDRSAALYQALERCQALLTEGELLQINCFDSGRCVIRAGSNESRVWRKLLDDLFSPADIGKLAGEGKLVVIERSRLGSCVLIGDQLPAAEDPGAESEVPY